MNTYQQNSNGRVNILGLPVDKITLKDCVRILESYISMRIPRQLVVVNAAKVVKACRDKELRNIIWSADLVGADGMPIVWASRILGNPLPGRVNGTDLMERLVKVSARKGYRLFLLGATQEVIEKAVTNFKKKYPDLIIAGYRNGYFNSDDEERQTVRTIAASRADILLVGMGTPMKEKFIRQYMNDLNVPVIHGVGGSFDVVSGLTKRAPGWMQKNGLEWLYRVCQEPQRMWHRYLVTNTLFIYMLFKAWLVREMGFK